MIISHKYKYIFVGVPFSASSAISKELIENYNGELFLHKHANIPYLLSVEKSIDLNDYFIFAVARNPVDMVFSVYNKMRTNAYNVYTDQKFFLENGGHVSKRSRKYFNEIKKESLNFEEYLLKRFSILPYDNYLSENAAYLNYTIDFNNLNYDFKKCLKELNIKTIRDLPLYNKTIKIEKEYNLSNYTIKKVFSSFYKYNCNSFNYSYVEPSLFNFFKFSLLRYLRTYRWKKIDYLHNKQIKEAID